MVQKSPLNKSRFSSLKSSSNDHCLLPNVHFTFWIFGQNEEGNCFKNLEMFQQLTTFDGFDIFPDQSFPLGHLSYNELK